MLWSEASLDGVGVQHASGVISNYRWVGLTNDTCPKLVVITPSSMLTELTSVKGLKKGLNVLEWPRCPGWCK